MSEIISVTVSAPDKPALLEGPVPATITVKNLSDRIVEILLPYPNPNNLSFDCSSADLAIRKQVERQRIERTLPIAVPPKRIHEATYFLNRYLRFQKAGEVRVSYRLGIVVTSEAQKDRAIHEDVSFTGEFPVTLIAGSEGDLRAEMASYADKVRSNNPQVKAEAAEALAFLDTPISVDYIAPMLSIDNLEVTGIRALARFPSPKTHDLIVGMLSHRESAVVAAALQEIDHLRIPIQRRQILALLASENPNIRWTSLEWLAGHPDKGDLPFIVPLLDDPSSPVRDRAKLYAGRLREMH